MIIIIIVFYSIFVSQNILIAPTSMLHTEGGNPSLQLQSNCDSGFATVQPFSFKHSPLLKSGSAPACRKLAKTHMQDSYKIRARSCKMQEKWSFPCKNVQVLQGYSCKILDSLVRLFYWEC